MDSTELGQPGTNWLSLLSTPQVTSKFELYTCLSPLVTKAGAILAVTKLLRWVKKEEDRLFIRYPPKYSTPPAAPVASTDHASHNGLFTGPWEAELSDWAVLRTTALGFYLLSSPWKWGRVGGLVAVVCLCVLIQSRPILLQPHRR